MKFFVTAQFPPEPFNSLMREGKAGEILQRAVQDINPESVLFTEIDGCRSVVMFVDLPDMSKIPSVTEPFFLNFDAEVHVRAAMTAEELQRGNLDALAQKWG